MIIPLAYRMVRVHWPVYILFVFGSIALLSGCRLPDNQPDTRDTDYFPLHTGDYWIYQIDEQHYSLTGAPTQRTYQVQHKIGSSFTQTGQTYFRLEESVRVNETTDWRIQAIHTIYKNSMEVVLLKERGPSRIMLFPIAEQTNWNKNTYQASQDTLLNYTDIRKSFQTGNQQFTNTISIVGPQDSTLVDQHIYRQTYAPNLGLIHQREVSIDYCQATPDCLGKAQIVSGYRRTWALIASNRFR